MTGRIDIDERRSGIEKPRIVHVTTAHDPRDIRVFRKQCRSLQEYFGNVHLVAPADQDFVESGVTVHAIRRHRSRIGRFLLTLPRAVVAALKLRPDVIHLHDPDLLLAALFLRRRFRVVFDSHEDYPRDLMSRPYLQGRIGRLVVRLYTWFETRVFKRIDAVVTVNLAMTLRVREVQANTATIYNFPIAGDIPRPVDKPLYPNKVVWLGLLNAARGVSTLNSAAGSLPDGTIETIGRCDDMPSGDSHLVNMGTMDYGNAIQRTANYAAGLVTFPSRDFHREMFPIKLFEYMLLGLPIIASDFPKWRAIMRSANCAIFVDPDDPEEIAAAVQHILDNPTEAAAMGRRGRQLALESFSWSGEARKLIALYDCILGNSGEYSAGEFVDSFEASENELPA